jgi:hypothetical protein
MKTLNAQTQRANGEWADLNDRTDSFVDSCVDFNSDIDTRDQVIDLLLAGKEVKFGHDWNECIRNKKSVAPIVPVIDSVDHDNYL